MSTKAEAGALVTGGGRSLTMLKDEVTRRVARGGPPLGGIAVEDAAAALQSIDSLDREQWASAFSSVAERHYERAAKLESSDRDAAAQAYWRAWRLHHFARWPTENTPARLHAKQRALDAFQRYSALLDPPMETLRVPLDDKAVVAYLRAPRTSEPAPVVLAISGLDSRKEDIAAHTDAYLKRGIAVVAVDMPGTGEAPTSPTEAKPERMFTALIDYLLTRDDIDATRLVVQGRSFSGYWAAKLGYTERDRLRGVVMHGGPIHYTFQPEWCAQALETGEYLYDYFEAWRAMMGATALDEMLASVARLSLLDMGLLDRPCAPMLVVNGAKDSQITIEDVFLLLKHGDAKDAWVNPQGGHMGRSPEWPQPLIAEKVLMPWMAKKLAE
ncbi:MAG: alpha/beta hydrolase [Rhodospirillaceae bacterium]